MKTEIANKGENKKKKMNARLRGDKLFFWGILLYPILHFIIFYLYVNVDGFVLAFQSFDVETQTYSFASDPWRSFRRFFTDIGASDEVLVGMWRSFILYCFGLFICTPIVFYFSFVMYKKVPGHHFFKVAFYIPTIISSTVWVLLYTQLMENGVPSLYLKLTGEKIGGVLSNPETSFFAITYFGKFWYSFGGGTLLYIATMSGIPEERSEAMRIDGAGTLTEFFHLTLPAIWPIWSLGLYTGVIGIITSDVGLYTFYSESAPTELRTFGYWLRVRKFRAASNQSDLPYVAAIGMLQGAIFIPLMFIVRKSLQKLGPSED